jgi:hypothetical protein
MYTKNNAGIKIAENSRVYERLNSVIAIPTGYLFVAGQLSLIQFMNDEVVAPQPIAVLEKQGHLVLDAKELAKTNAMPVKNYGDIKVNLSISDEADLEGNTAQDGFAYIGIAAGGGEAGKTSVYPMFTSECNANAQLVIGGDFGESTLDQLAELAMNNELEIHKIVADVTDDNFFSNKLAVGGKESDGDNKGDRTFRFKQNDQYTENTKNRIMTLGAGTDAGTVVLDGMTYLRIKIIKGNPVELTFHYKLHE